VVGLFVKRPWRLPRLLSAVPAVLGYFLQLTGRGPLKATLARAAFGGLEQSDVEGLAAAYVAAVRSQGVFPGALEAIAAHRAAGDRLVLMSASPDLYIPQLGALLGFDEVICTRLAWKDGRFDGELLGENCRGTEKLRHLERLKARHPGWNTIGYGNSTPDLDHLVHCDEAVYVNARGATRRALSDKGIRLADWR
jgi:phosphatidylglycerophosphatase C